MNLSRESECLGRTLASNIVRKPFLSRHSQIGIVAGMLKSGEQLQLESLMPSGGAIFSDGIEADYLEFNSGAVARVG